MSELQKQKARELCVERNTTHGESHTRLYKIWKYIKRRCYNTNFWAFKRYGGRGIYVCEEWNKYEDFRAWALANGYRDDLTLDRKDNDGNYCPENCRWVTRKVQANNRNNNVVWEFEGEEHTVKEWSEIVGVNYTTLHSRVFRYGWSVEEALTTPKNGAYHVHSTP